jgi:hypothetical protein
MFGLIKRVTTAVFEAFKPSIRTHIVCTVIDYDGTTNTATVQPVNRALRTTDPDNLTTVEIPPLTDVPVMQRGSGKLWLTVAPAAGSYGVLHISDREIETWLAKGKINDPVSMRTHDINDALFEPGALPLIVDGDNGQLSPAIDTDRISLRTRDNVTHVSVLDDGTVSTHADANLAMSTAGNAGIEADGDVTVTGGGKVTLDNGTETLSVDGADVKAGGGADYAAMSTPTDLNFTLIDTIINAWVPVPMDGGAALKAAWIAAWPGGKQATASGNLKAD